MWASIVCCRVLKELTLPFSPTHVPSICPLTNCFRLQPAPCSPARVGHDLPVATNQNTTKRTAHHSLLGKHSSPSVHPF